MGVLLIPLICNHNLMSKTDRQHIGAIRIPGIFGFNNCFIFVRDQDDYGNDFIGWKFNRGQPFEYHQ